MSKKLTILLMFFVIAIGLIFGYQTTRPPSPPSASDPDYPAFQRMLANLEALTVAAHPSGSEALEAARAYLLAQIQAMGLEPVVESKTYTVDDIVKASLARQGSGQGERPRNAASLEENMAQDVRNSAVFDENDQFVLKNIVVKLDAPGTQRGILLLAHYDSTQDGPGAADDMLSVCSLLEAMRAQAGNAGLQNDLYFLFTDGEELGALGAKAFLEAHPELLNTIDLVINLDARGNRGGLLMFETSANNYNLLRYYHSASSHPLAFSYLPALYRRMPNGTDLTDFLNAGYSGLNFAVIEGEEHYHGPSDSVETLDRGTAYHYLQTSLEMAGSGSQAPLDAFSAAQDSVYFPFLPGTLVLMSSLASYLLSGLVILAALAWLVVQVKSGKVRLRQIAGGSVWLLGMLAGVAFLSWGIVSVVMRATREEGSNNNPAVFLSLACVLGLSALAVFLLRMRRQSLREALAGLLPLQVLLAAATALFFNGISYLFVLPTLGMLIVALLERNAYGRLAASALLGVAAWLLYVPTIWLIYTAFMLPAAPLVIALSVMPIAMLAAFFAAQ